MFFSRKQQKITNNQNEKFDEYESKRLTTMAEMRFIENQLQVFDINAKPSVTHTQVEKLQKVIFFSRKKKKSNLDFIFFKDLDNTRCEYEILRQHIDHYMPCDEPVKSILKNQS